MGGDPNNQKSSKQLKKPIELNSLDSYKKHIADCKTDLYEMIDESSKDEKPKMQSFADHWLEKSYKPIISETKDTYLKLLCVDVKNIFAKKSIPFELPSEDTIVKEFVVKWDKLWPKFLQACLNDLAKECKQKPITLAEDEFTDLPEHALNNMK